MRARHRLLAVAGLILAVTLALAPVGQAHAYLEASTPSPNGETAVGKTVLALRFTEVIDPDHTRVRLEGPDGSTVATRIDRPSDRPRVIRVEVAPLDQGSYELHWSTFSIDSHVDHGTVPFTVGQGSGTPSGAIRAFDPGAQDPRLVALETVARLVFLAGALVAFGLPIYLSEVDPAEVPSKRSATTVMASGALGVAGAAVLFGVMTTRLSVSPWEAAGTLPGRFLVGKAALLSGVAMLAHRARSAPGPRRLAPLLVGVVAALGAIVLHSMGSHGVLEMSARKSAAGHVAMTLHLAASGLWVGGLVGLLLDVRDRQALVERIRAFTPLAIASVIAIGGTGLVQAYVHLPSLAALWSSSFGWALLAKTGLLAIVLGFGAWHGFGLPDRLDEGSRGPAGFRRSGTVEVLLLAGILLAAGAMGALPVPPEEVDADDGPLAVYEEERHLDHHDLRLRILADPIHAEEPIELDLTIEPTSSIGVGNATAEAILAGPGNRTIPVELEPAGKTGPADTARLWRAFPVELPQPGSWTLTLNVTLPSGPIVERFTVPIQPAPTEG